MMHGMLFVGCHPYLGDGDPFNLLDVLEEVSNLGATCYILGHVPIGGITDVKLLIEYIKHCIDVAGLLVKTGGVCEAEMQTLKIDDRFQNWFLPQFYQSNIGFLCKHLNSQGES